MTLGTRARARPKSFNLSRVSRTKSGIFDDSVGSGFEGSNGLGSVAEEGENLGRLTVAPLRKDGSLRRLMEGGSGGKGRQTMPVRKITRIKEEDAGREAGSYCGFDDFSMRENRGSFGGGKGGLRVPGGMSTISKVSRSGRVSVSRGQKSDNNKQRMTTPIRGKSRSNPRLSGFASKGLEELDDGNLSDRSNDGYLAAPKNNFITRSGKSMDLDADPERSKWPNPRASLLIPTYDTPGLRSHKIIKRNHSLRLDSSPKLQAARITQKLEEASGSTVESSDSGQRKPKMKNPYKKFYCTHSRQFMQESFYSPKKTRKLNHSSTYATLPVSKQDLSKAWSKNSKRYNLIFKKAVVRANRLTSPLEHSRIDFLHIPMPKNWSDPNWIQNQNHGVPSYSDICLHQKDSPCEHDNREKNLVIRKASNQLGVSHDFSQPSGVHPYSHTGSQKRETMAPRSPKRVTLGGVKKFKENQIKTEEGPPPKIHRKKSVDSRKSDQVNKAPSPSPTIDLEQCEDLSAQSSETTKAKPRGRNSLDTPEANPGMRLGNKSPQGSL